MMDAPHSVNLRQVGLVQVVHQLYLILALKFVGMDLILELWDVMMVTR